MKNMAGKLNLHPCTLRAVFTVALPVQLWQGNQGVQTSSTLRVTVNIFVFILSKRQQILQLGTRIRLVCVLLTIPKARGNV